MFFRRLIPGELQKAEFSDAFSADFISESATWASWKNSASLVIPSSKLTNEIAYEFEFNNRLDAGDTVTFKAFDSDELEVGNIYLCYLTSSTDYQVATTFILTQKRLIKDGADCEKRYECEGISIQDLAFRKLLNVNLRNRRFKPFLEEVVRLARLYNPEISDDFSLIQDVDFTFSIFKQNGVFLGEIFQQLREAGYEVYIDENLKVRACEPSFYTVQTIDFFRSKIGAKNCVLSNSRVSLDYDSSPATSLIVEAGQSSASETLSLQVLSSAQTQYDLTGRIDREGTFMLEAYESINFNNKTFLNNGNAGWNQRYLVDDIPFLVSAGVRLDSKFQVLDITKEQLLGGLTAGEYSPADCKAGFLIRNDDVILIADGVEIPTTKTVKPYFQSAVTSVNLTTKQQFVLDSVAGLVVGDIVSIAGTTATIAAAGATITAISGNEITISPAAIGATADDSLLCIRSTDYIFRLKVNKALETEFIFKEGNSPEELLSTEEIDYGQVDYFAVLYSSLSLPTAVQGEGVLEVGGVAIDYSFLDRAVNIKVEDQDDDYLLLCSNDQFATVEADLVVNEIEKNGDTLSQIEFISPSLIKFVFQASLGTTTRIPLVLDDQDFVSIGMRCLINNESYLVSGFKYGLTDGYIDVSPALPAPLAEKTEVYINTTIPADGERFKVFFNKVIDLKIRRCAGEACKARFGFREKIISFPDITDIAELRLRSQELINSQCQPSPSGAYGYTMQAGCSTAGVLDYERTPFPGDYISASDSQQSITSQLARIEAITVRQIGAGLLNIGINFGSVKKNTASLVTSLARKVGIFRGEEGKGVDLPCQLIETSEIIDTITFTEESTSNFYGGLFQVNFSGA